MVLAQMRVYNNIQTTANPLNSLHPKTETLPY